MDIYHFLVPSETDKDNSTSPPQSATWSADFTDRGSVIVTFDQSYNGSTTATYSGGTFGLTSIQSNHLWVAVPMGRKIIDAKLNYKVVLTAGTAWNAKPTTLNTSHVLSHTCASPSQPPTITVDSATPSYTETWDESYSWTVEKTLVVDGDNDPTKLYYSRGLMPEFSVTATRSTERTKSGWAVVDGTQQVSGTFTVTNATLAQSTISLTGADCTTRDDNPGDLTFEYTCVWGTEGSVSGDDGLQGVNFTVNGSATNDIGSGNGQYANTFDSQSGSSAVGNIYNKSASLTDDLGGIGGNVVSCTGLGETDCESLIADGSLEVPATQGSFSVNYTVSWDWTKMKTSAECTAGFTNTATLAILRNIGDTTAASTEVDSVTSATSCPVPTVSLGSKSSSYGISYDNVYSWDITKEFKGQDEESFNAKYEVTAERSGPTENNVSVTPATIEGSYTTTNTGYDDQTNVSVSVTVTYDGRTPVDCDVDQDAKTYSCEITGLTANGARNGLTVSGYTVSATVTTPGGTSAEDSTNGDLGSVTATETDVNATANVVDDLGGYKAVSITCSGATCPDDPAEVAAGNDLVTGTSSSTITVNYELEWLPTADRSETCPTITNVAEVMNGEDSLDDDTSIEEMDCPTPTVEISSVTPSYTETWDESYTWTIEKTLVVDGDNDPTKQYYSKGLMPEFSVTATRSTERTESGWAVSDGTQQVSGTFTLTDAALADATVSIPGTSAECTTRDDNPGDLTFEYTCVWVTESSVSSQDGLDGSDFTVNIALDAPWGENSATDDTNEFGAQSGSSALANIYNESASLTDDLGSIGGSGESCTGDLVEDCDASITGTTLSVPETEGSFTVTYTVSWDWTAMKTSAECTAGFTNTATLAILKNPGDETADDTMDDSVESGTSCPVPTVDLGNTSATYSISYDNVYSWSITKEFKGQDETSFNAKYQVTAERLGPVAENTNVSSATVTGSYSTTNTGYDDQSTVNVTVTVTYDGNDFECTVNQDAGTYSCTVTGLNANDALDGLDVSDYTVTATVTTPGGTSDEDSVDGDMGSVTPSVTPVNATANVVDDLGGYKAVSITCSGATCPDDPAEVAAGDELVTGSSSSTITVNYELEWLPTADVTAACPTITNIADVMNGEDSLDDATSSEEMNCPTPDVSLSGTSSYLQTWDEEYGWTVTKEFKGQDPATMKPQYQVTATRGSSSVSGHRIVDGSQWISGTLSFGSLPASFRPAVVGSLTLTMAGAVCDAPTDADNDGIYAFGCTVTNEPNVTGPNGLSSVSYEVTAEVSLFNENSSDTLSDTWGDQSAASSRDKVKYESGKLVDSLVAVNGGSIVTASPSALVQDNVVVSGSSSSSITVKYTANWGTLNTDYCGQSVTNLVELKDTVSDDTVASASTTTSMSCSTSTGGLTIGYWGNKMGGKEVVAKKSTWLDSNFDWYPVLSRINGAANWQSDSQVRDYMNKANCSTDCRTMFLAQALASVMNHLRSGDYQNQRVMFKGACVSVKSLFNTALGSTASVYDSNTAAGLSLRIAYKSIFDDLNNNRAQRCPAA